ncbi:MAG: YihY/virulence factor BrkB family protein [Chitinophagaceae bacterium]
MRNKITFKGIWEVLKESFKGFSEDKVTKLSASLAYYTVFSLGPLLIVIIFLCSIFLGREAVEGTIYRQLENFIGNDSAKQVEEIIKNASIGGKGKIAAIIGVITLLIGATGVFAEIQDSINSIWGLKAKPKQGMMKMIKSRLLSFGLIGSLGFLLLVSLAVTAVIEGLGNKLQNMFPDVGVVVLYIVNLILTLGIVTVLFAVIFKVLPDAKIKWKDVWAGAIITGLLFLIGKFAISFYIGKSDVGSTYGAAGSLVILLLWIYYSAMILYFGAEFTRAYAVKYAGQIEPNEYAVLTKEVEVEAGKGSVQEQENKKNQVKEGRQPQAVTRQKTNRSSGNNEERKKSSSEQPGKTHNQPHNVIATGTYRIIKEDDKKPVGVLTALGGLVLYYLNRAGK